VVKQQSLHLEMFKTFATQISFII